MCVQHVLYLTSHCHGVYVLNVKTVFNSTIEMYSCGSLYNNIVLYVLLWRKYSSGSRYWGGRKVSIVDLAFPTVHILLHSLMLGNAAFRSTVYMHIWVVWHYTQIRGVTCYSNALAVYTIHGLSACISKQVMVGKVPNEKAGKWNPSESWLWCCLQYCQEQ